jgi:hypothetical protein
MNDVENGPSRLLKALARHVVHLSCLDAKIQPDGIVTDVRNFDLRAFSVTTFVISVRDVWFLVTAGHILRDVENRLKAGRQIVKARLTDGFGTNDALPPIVFPFGDTPEWHVFSSGVDYALFPLRPLYARQLVAGGVEPLDEQAWTDTPDHPDAYYLLGFPDEATDVSVNSRADGGVVNVSTGTPLLPVLPITDPPDTMKLTGERFYAKVPVTKGTGEGREIKLTDISGMSGGPVFAVAHDGQKTLRYWVVAVQSGWLKESRILAACPIIPLVDGIVRCMDQHKDELEGHEMHDKEEGV